MSRAQIFSPIFPLNKAQGAAYTHFSPNYPYSLGLISLSSSDVLILRSISPQWISGPCSAFDLRIVWDVEACEVLCGSGVREARYNK